MITLSRPEIEALIDPLKAATAIEDAYRAVSRNEVNLPPVGHITFPEHHADCHIKDVTDLTGLAVQDIAMARIVLAAHAETTAPDPP